MDITARVFGLALVIASLIVFVAFLPRGGRVNPILKSDLAESTLMMVVISLFFSGAILALSGAPPGLPMTSVR